VGAELLVPLLIVVGIFAVVFAAARWALRETREGASAKQKLDDLAQISRRETEAQDALTARKATLKQLVDRWRRIVGGVRDKDGPSGGSGTRPPP